MIGFLLFIIAFLLKCIFYPIGFFYSVIATFLKSGYVALDKYLFKCAIADDQHANTWLAKLFNDILIKKEGHQFGNPDETISSVLGKNYLNKKLSLAGKVLNWILNLIDPGHSVKSIE